MTANVVGLKVLPHTQIFAYRDEDPLPFGDRITSQAGALAFKADLFAIEQESKDCHVTQNQVGSAVFTLYNAYLNDQKQLDLMDLLDDPEDEAYHLYVALKKILPISNIKIEDIDRISIEPKFRGLGLGLLALKTIVRNFAPNGPGGVVMLHAFGLSDKYDRTGHQQSLTDYWMKSGIFAGHVDHVLYHFTEFRWGEG